MELNKENTQWIFLLPSEKSAEERHVLDALFGYYILKDKGVDESDIFLLIDADDLNLYKQGDSPFPKDERIKRSDNLKNILLENKKENVVLFVCGHGSIVGLPNRETPFSFFEKLKKTKNAKHFVVFFSQCYAGIFENVLTQSDINGIEFILIGATELESSMSSPLRQNKKIWTVNTFLFSLFEWIKNPIDIDGDSFFSVNDAFKYAGIRMNSFGKEIKSLEHMESLSKIFDLEKIKEEARKDSLKKLLYTLKKESLQKILEIIYTHQRPWISNPETARNLYFSL